MHIRDVWGPGGTEGAAAAAEAMGANTTASGQRRAWRAARPAVGRSAEWEEKVDFENQNFRS